MSLRALLKTVGLVGCFVGCGAFSVQCRASTRRGSVALDYAAPSRCPAEDQFWVRFGRYSSVGTENEGNGVAASIAIAIEPSADGFSALLTVSTPAQKMTRRLSDAQCDALVDALALVAAIATDSTHRNVSAPDRPKTEISKPIPIRLTLGSPPTWILGVAFGLRNDATPVVLRTLGAYLGVRRNDFGMTGYYSAILDFGRTDWLPFRLGEARFTWFAGRVTACPIGSSVRRFSFGVCALSEFGWLEGEGNSEAGPTSTGGLWVAPGLGLTASVVFSRFDLGFFGAAVTPILRDRFYFAPDETVFRPSGIGLVAEMRLGWVIW